MNITVFTGLSLSPQKVRAVLPQAQVKGPIASGDLKRENVVVIIDGKFHGVQSITPSEIMSALRAGVRVYGSSSMGALRAAELNRYGMIGCGRIYDHICASSIFADDLVGQSFFEERTENIASTHIDFYFNLLTLKDANRLSRNEAAILLNAHKRLDFATRSWATFEMSLKARRSMKPELLKLAKLAYLKMGSQKSRDATELLKMVRSDVAQLKVINRQLSCASFRAR